MRIYSPFPGADTTTLLLSGIELCAGVLCACLPTMLPIWNYLHHVRAQSSARTYKFTPASGPYTGPKASNMKALLRSGSGKHDASVKLQDGPFQRLREEGADARLPTPPPMAIRVTTNIETSRKMPLLEISDNTVEARQPGW